MTITNIISSITRTGNYPESKVIDAENNCGTFCLTLGSIWTEQMLCELPTINISFWIDSLTKIASIDIDMRTVNEDTVKISSIDPYAIPIYDLPSEFMVKVTPLFDKYALAAHNDQIENGNIESFNTSDIGIVDTDTDDYSSELWSTPTSTFTISIDFNDTNIKSGSSGGSSSADKISYSNSTSGLTATNVQEAIDEVNNKVDTLPDPMIFIGTVGTGGTVQSLDPASEANKGYTYKVITAGTYQGVAAEVGDTLISNGTTWILIPSGDEPSGTVTNVDISSNDGSVTITGSPITSSGTIDISVNVDSALNENSTKPVQNALLTRLLTPMTQADYDVLTNKDLPLYFIYEV